MITRSWGLLLTPFLLAAAPLGNPDPAQVTGLSLSPAGGEAELVVAMSGAAVRWSDFTLENPSRVVVDITGARNALPQSRFERIDRAASRQELNGGPKARAAEATHRLAGGMDATAGFLREPDTQRLREDFEFRVRENPFRAVLITVAAGFIAGRILR